MRLVIRGVRRGIRDDSALEIPEPDFKGTLSGVLAAVESLI